MFQGPVSSQSGTGAWGLPWPSASRRPQDSQTGTVIGRRRDIPRETHLHAWVTPTASCFLTLQEIRAGSLLWEDRAGFHGNPQLPHPSWLGREGRRPAEIAPGRSLVRGCYPDVLGKSPSDFPLPNQGCFVTETRFSPVFEKGPIPFKGDTSLEPQSLRRDDSPTRQLQVVSEILKYSLGDNALNPPLFQSLLFFLSSLKKYKL